MFCVWALLAAKSVLTASLSAAVLLTALSLIAFGIGVIRTALLVPRLSDQPSERRRIGRQFGIIVAAEAFACTVLSIACLATHQWRLIVPLNLIVVGLHFLPLARLFGVPRYYLLGTLFCLVPLITMIFVPVLGHVGAVLSWLFIPSVSCGLTALLIGWAGLNEVRRNLGTL